MTKTETKDKNLNKAKNSAYSGIYSIAGVWASVIYLIADIFMDDKATAVVSWFIMIAIVLVSWFTNKKLTTELNKGSEKAAKWCAIIDKHAVNAGYIGIVVLTFSFLFNMLTLT